MQNIEIMDNENIVITKINKTPIYTLRAAANYRHKRDSDKNSELYKKHLEYMKSYMKKRYDAKKAEREEIKAKHYEIKNNIFLSSV